MWILESNGDFLQGKRMWLKPGKKYLFGRVKKDGVRFAIDHKTVSRKHFVITVEDIKDQDVGNVYARSHITITDENSKAGTNIDGVLIKGKSQELKNAVTSIRPGSCPHELLITWVPRVITFGLSKKEIKNGLLKAKQDQIKELDIKAVSDYLSEQTTHLVTQKRNTAKGLQALIEGKHIVTDTYIDALIYASAPADLDEEERLCALEVDFEEAWPDPAHHLPPKGKEPTERPADSYRPDPARKKIFDKYVFVFFDHVQYDQLLPPITTGHGKAVIFKPTDTSTVEEAHDFVRNAVSNQTRAILVRVNEPDEGQSPVTNLIDNLAKRLGIEPASQSGFLDAILANDASQLRKPQSLSTASNVSATPHLGRELSHMNGHVNNGSSSTLRSQPSAPSPKQGSVASDSAPSRNVRGASEQSSIPDDNPRPFKRARYIPPKKGFDNFDDDFNPDAIVVYEEVEPSQPATQHRSQRTAKSQVDQDFPVKEEPTSTNRHAKSPTPLEDSEVDDNMDDLLPAAAAMRRQKQRDDAEARRKGEPVKSAIPQAKLEPFLKPKKEVKLIDVREALRARKEAEKEADEKERRHVQELQEEEDDHKGPANLVKIVEYELPVRQHSDNGINAYKGVEWKPEWNGRPNYKGFRRARDANTNGNSPAKRPEKIIVPLVAAKKQSYGIGDQYWEKSQEERARAAKEKERKKRASQKTSHSQIRPQSKSRSQHSQTVHDSDSESNSDSETNETTTRTNNAAQNEDENENDPTNLNAETTRLQTEAANVLNHTIDLDAPRQTRAHDPHTQTQTQNPSRITQSTKRPASKTPPGKIAAPKRQKTLPITVVHGSESEVDSDDSDELKFKFGRARNGVR